MLGLLGGLIGLSAGGGQPVIQHFILRYCLWRNGSMPWHIARFLDFCAERIFLRKVGGGYIFIHRLLLVH
jgi:eukaryotic-like serine/threonine-protein kinase